MTKCALQFIVFLVIFVGLGLVLTALAASSSAEPTPAAAGADTATPQALSPSQEAREEINRIRSNEFFYQSFGKSDPFRSLVDGKFEQQTAAELVDLSSARLVGVIWGGEDRFALVEDGDGFGYILRVGDRVRNGRVVSIRKSSLTARITLYGITNSVVLKLDKTEG
jgi:hypothetical protein